MLRLAKLRRGGHAYYLEVAKGPENEGIEVPGEWMGVGARALGLTGPVTADQLEAVFEGRHPHTGIPLGPSHHRVTVAAYDLTFCAPKSVSLLHALGPPEVASEVRAAHVAAANGALAYVADRAIAVRREVDGARLPLRAQSVPSAGFVHRVSRALDPHLHAHVVVANLGCDAAGRWSALDGRGLYAHAPAAGALFHAQLRYELTARLGVAWEPLRGGRADIEGIGVEARRAFSQRAASIARHLADRGLSSHRATEIASHATRPARRSDIAPEDLAEWWRARARAVGLSPGRVAAVVGRVVARGAHDGVDEGRGSVVQAALQERGRPAARRDVVRAWCEALPWGAPARAVTGAADRTLAAVSGAVTGGEPASRDVRGVGEPRYDLGAALGTDIPTRRPGIDRDLARALMARGMDLPVGAARHRGAARDLGADLGMGFG